MFLTKKHLSRRTVLKAAGVSLGLPFLDAMVPARYGARADGRRAEAARRVLLPAARRDHVEHRLRRRDGPLDTQRRRRGLQAEPDSRAARVVQALRHIVRQHREQSAARVGPHARARHVALRRSTRIRRRRAR